MEQFLDTWKENCFPESTITRSQTISWMTTSRDREHGIKASPVSKTAKDYEHDLLRGGREPVGGIVMEPAKPSGYVKQIDPVTKVESAGYLSPMEHQGRLWGGAPSDL